MTAAVLFEYQSEEEPCWRVVQESASNRQTAFWFGTRGVSDPHEAPVSKQLVSYTGHVHKYVLRGKRQLTYGTEIRR